MELRLALNKIQSDILMKVTLAVVSVSIVHLDMVPKKGRNAMKVVLWIVLFNYWRRCRGAVGICYFVLQNYFF